MTELYTDGFIKLKVKRMSLMKRTVLMMSCVFGSVPLVKQRQGVRLARMLVRGIPQMVCLIYIIILCAVVLCFAGQLSRYTCRWVVAPIGKCLIQLRYMSWKLSVYVVT